MIRYVIFAAAIALSAACLSACTTIWGGGDHAPGSYRDPAPKDRRHADDSEGAKSSNASYSSQLSVMDRRACHAKHEKNCG